jgi:hypothetical protein
VTKITGVDLTYGEPALTTPAGVFAFSDIKRLMRQYGATNYARTNSPAQKRAVWLHKRPTNPQSNPAPQVFWELRP